MSNAAQPRSRDSHRPDSVADSTTGNVVPIRVADEGDPLASFRPEGEPAPPSTPKPAVAARRNPFASQKLIIIATIAALAIASAAAAGWRYWTTTSAAKPMPVEGFVTFNSRPAGALVTIDGVARGATPLEVQVVAGQHDAVLRLGTAERTVRLTVDRGTRVVENIDMPVADATLAQIDVTSEPSGARVLLDGKAVGQTPMKIRDVEAGRHSIGIASAASTVNRTVDVAAGATASVFVSLGSSAAPSIGSVAVESGPELRLLENGQLLGLSNAAPLPMSAGKHQFDLVNDALELHLTRAVTIEPGKVTRVSVPMPNGTLFANAAPWAEVFVDGKSIGTTPLGNVAVPVGTHDVVWRHPNLGERRRSITVGARTPVRIAVDMTR